MNDLRILIALELRSYREAIAEVIRALQPEAEILLSEPGDLERKASLMDPLVVICSDVSAVEQKTPYWVEMYKEQGSYSTARTPEYLWAITEFGLSDLAGLLSLAELNVRNGT